MNNENEQTRICLEDTDKPKIEYLYDYSKFLGDGFELDDELLTKFQPIAQKLNLSQESIDMLLEIALEMSKKQRAIYQTDEKTKLNNTIAKYDKMFKDDPELPDLNSRNVNDYMKLANEAYRKFSTPKLKEVLTATGLNYHPELIKLFHKIGELIEEDSISYDGKPKFEELTPAQILYGPRK